MPKVEARIVIQQAYREFVHRPEQRCVYGIRPPRKEIALHLNPKRRMLLLSRLGRLIRGIAHLLRVVEADQVKEAHRAEPEDEHVEQQEGRSGGQA